ncbi:unnamed protein product [Linum trigynum]|uniref:WAP domain-containing protein n=1 Tax=Linum trigynum TaxID=586398 RepID=A0AAV2F2C0_9ROSI
MVCTVAGVTSWDSGESRSVEPYSEKKDVAAPTAVAAPDDNNGSKGKRINDAAISRTRGGGGISPAAAAATLRPFSNKYYPDCKDNLGRALCNADYDCDLFMPCDTGTKCVKGCCYCN